MIQSSTPQPCESIEMHLSLAGDPRVLGAAVRLLRRYHNAAIFVGGFLFDVFTVGPIDSWIDISIEVAYLTAVTVLLVLEHREEQGVWRPSPRFARLWHYNVEAMHFLYGGLLSINIVFYFRSTTGARPVIFLFLLAAVFLLNEMPWARARGHRLRLGLYTLCLTTVTIYLVPLAVGAMGDVVFLASMGITGGLLWGLSRWLAIQGHGPSASRAQLVAPGAAVLVAILVLYFLRLVPPVPLSVQSQGIYHEVTHTEAGYVLRALRSPIHLFWRKDDRPFRARPGDRIVYFVRVFAPSRFSHQVTIRWERWDAAA